MMCCPKKVKFKKIQIKRNERKCAKALEELLYEMNVTGLIPLCTLRMLNLQFKLCIGIVSLTSSMELYTS